MSDGAIIERHHYASNDAESGEVIHVFAFAGPPVYPIPGDAEKSWEFDINFAIGPASFNLVGYVDLASLEIKATLYVKVGFWTFKLAEVQGNLNDGVSVEFGVSVLSGKATFYLKEKWLWVDLTATIFGTTYGPLSFKLIPIPI